MRRFGKWVLTLGIVASFQASGVAGPFDGLFQSKKSAESTASSPAAKSANQQAAEGIARNLKAEQLTTKNVRIAYADGTVTLTGEILNAQQKARAYQAALKSPGVRAVNNQLTVMQQQVNPAFARKGGFPQTAAASNRPQQNRIQQVGFEQATGNRGRIQQASGEEAQELPAFAQESAAPQTAAVDNQAVAEDIARALGAAKLNGYDIEISYQDGIAQLAGQVGSHAQFAAAGQAASRVPGVQRVDNQLRYAGPQAAPQQGPGQQQAMSPQQQQAAQAQFIAYQRYMAARQQYAAQQAAMRGYQPGAGGQVPPANPAGPLIPGSGGPGAGGPGAPQGYGHPGGGAQPVTYNQPNLPDYAWPAYANYPNSAQVNYPKEYSASAWPYIGPFYPYPQVPLGWRKAQLEWDDGYWKLDFDSKTDRWWWFVNPKNW